MKLKILLGGVNLLDDDGQYSSSDNSPFNKTPFNIVWRPVPIGLLYITAAQRAFGKTECEYQLFDFDVPEKEKFSLERVFSDFEKTLSDFRPDIVALGCLTFNQAHYLEQAVKIAKNYLEEIKPNGHIVAGGRPASSDPEIFLKAGADIVCIGEGEMTFPEIVDCLADDGDLAKVNGIVFTESDGNIHKTPSRPLVNDLDTLPMPAWDLVDMQVLKRRNKRIFSPIASSRGCPYSCIYCDHVKQYRAHSPKRVADEVEYLTKKYGFSGIDIVDEVFNLQKKRILGIREEFRQRNIQVDLFDYVGLRGDILDEESIDALHDMGMKGISVAIETASPRVQELIGKRLNIERTKKNIELLAERNIFVNAFFMVGFPTEEPEEMDTTLNMARDCHSHQSLISKVHIIPGTALHDLAIQNGLDPNYTIADSDRYGLRKDFGILKVSESTLDTLVDNALFDVYNNVPRMERIYRQMVAPIFFYQMYKKFYVEHNVWSENFSKVFDKAMSATPIDFQGLSQHASSERSRIKQSN